MGHRRTIVWLAAASVACASLPEPGEVGTPDGLERVAFYGVFGAFAKPGARLDGYEAVHFEPGVLSYREAPRYPRGRRVPLTSAAQTVELGAADLRRLREQVEEVFSREFAAHSQLKPVSSAGPNTLTVRIHVLDLVVTETGRSRGAESRFSLRGPVFTVVLDVRDSQDDVPLARIVDRRSAVPRSGVVRRIDSALDPGSLRRALHHWARALRRHLAEMRA